MNQNKNHFFFELSPNGGQYSVHCGLLRGKIYGFFREGKFQGESRDVIKTLSETFGMRLLYLKQKSLC